MNYAQASLIFFRRRYTYTCTYVLSEQSIIYIIRVHFFHQISMSHYKQFTNNYVHLLKYLRENFGRTKLTSRVHNNLLLLSLNKTRRGCYYIQVVWSLPFPPLFLSLIMAGSCTEKQLSSRSPPKCITLDSTQFHSKQDVPKTGCLFWSILTNLNSQMVN